MCMDLKSMLSGSAKGLKRYKGTYTHGEAWFTYREGEEENAYEGDFVYRHDYTEYGHEAYTYVKGKFKNDHKNGIWKFHHKDNGGLVKARIGYSDGIVEGPYEMVRLSNDGLFGLLPKKTHQLALHLTSGVPVGDIDGFSRYQTFHAHCDQAGFPDGTWTLVDADEDKSTSYTEVWEHGVLRESFYTDALSGRKITCDERIRKVIERLVQHYTYGLERRIEKGSNFWRGRIHTFKGGK